ncbi:S-layer family protein, partial [Candidatus Bathyarchaeota archaeon]
MQNGTISADTIDANGAPIAVDIQLTGDLSITADVNPAITARTTGSGDAGEIRIASKNMEVFTSIEDVFTVIDSHTSGSGRGGNVTITTGDLQMTGDPFGITFMIDSGFIGSDGGHGGNVTITAHSIEMQDANITSGYAVAQLFGEDATGAAGNVRVTTDSLHLNFSSIDASGASLRDRTGSIGRAGDITVTARDIQLEDSSLSSQGFERGGTITVNADHLVMLDSVITSQTNLLAGGGVTVSANVVELRQASQLVSSTGGNGDAGPIHVTVNDHLSLLEGVNFFRPSGIFTNSFGAFGSGLGHAGDVFITTPRLEMSSGARINTATQSSGRGGNVTIQATDSITISGEFPTKILEPLFNLGTIHPSGIFTSTVGGKCSGSCGDAGRISITTGSLNLGSGGRINSGTSSTGRGGDTSIHATDNVSLSGTLSDGTPAGVFSRTIGTAPGSGAGGDITSTAGQGVTLSNGAAISASSSGPANAGNITINAGNSFLMQNSSVTTQATQAGGGNITVNAGDMVRLTNSQINTSVAGGPGGGGNITIDPNFVILQNSQILAQAFAGQGGNITITTGTFLPDANSLVDASSQLGLNGTVTIQSPTSNLSSVWARLQQNYAEVAGLLRARCSAQVGGTYSSFVLAGRDSLPLEPGGWLPSPMAALSAGERPVARGEGAQIVVASNA